MSIPNILYAVERREIIAPKTRFQRPANCAVAACHAILLYDQELTKHKATEVELRKVIIREKALLREKMNLIEQRDVLAKESEHRLLNGLQLITSLLSMQSRATKNAEASKELNIATNRVAMLGRIHRHLHTLDHTETVEFKQYLEKLSYDLFGLVSTQFQERSLAFEGDELKISTAAAIPLGFIASELITNSIKYAAGKITVCLRAFSRECAALSVSDEGPGLPRAFDPTATNGLGMKLISAFTRQIGGELQVAKGDHNQGTRVTVLFPQQDPWS